MKLTRTAKNIGWASLGFLLGTCAGCDDTEAETLDQRLQSEVLDREESLETNSKYGLQHSMILEETGIEEVSYESEIMTYE